MKLSTKGRYAVMAMVDLAQVENLGIPVALAEISARQLLPVQYLEQLFVKLRKADLVTSVRGQGGGYYLSRAAHTIAIADIIKAVGEELRATGCEGEGPHQLGCQRTGTRCLTHNLWSGLDYVMQRYLETVTLEDVAERRIDSHGFVMTMPAHALTTGVEKADYNVIEAQ